MSKNGIDRRLVEIFMELVALDGTSGAERDVADYVKRFLTALGYRVTEDEANGRGEKRAGNIICHVGEGGELMLLSHMDTARSTQKLKAIIQEDRICSDGTTILGADNRAGMAAILRTLERIVHDKLEVKPFYVAFTICEESSLLGSRTIQIPSGVKMGFILDSSQRPGNFIVGSFGAKGFKVAIHGRASHAGLRPEEGISAIVVAAKAIASLELGRIDDHTTANIGMMNGGTAVNVVPELVELEGEVRALEVSRVDAILEKIRKTFEDTAKQHGASVEFQEKWDFHPFLIDASNATYQQISKALSQAGLSPEPKIVAGGSDANSLNERGLSAVNIGIGAQNPHANNEFILLKDLQKTTEIAFELVRI